MEKIIDTNTEIKTLVKNSITKAVSYKYFRAQVAEHVENGTSSGPNQSEALSQYTLLNNSRMKRLDKTTKISEEISEEISEL